MISLVGGVVGALHAAGHAAGYLRAAAAVAGAVRDRGFRLGQLFRAGAADEQRRLPARRAARQFCIAIYGGYFGGGIGFLMLAALTIAGLAVRTAGATKNVLAGVMNASAVLIFVFSRTCTGCRRW